MSNLRTFSEQVDARVPGDRFGLNNFVFIKQALRQFEHDRPKVETIDVTVASPSNNFNLGEIASNFDVGYGSQGIVSIEYPIINTERTSPVYLNRDQFYYYFDPSEASGEEHRLRFVTQIQQDFRITYRVPYEVTENSSDVPDRHVTDVSVLAAAKKASSIAARYSDTRSLTEATDFIDFQQKATDFRVLAQQLFAEYELLSDDFRDDVHPETHQVEKTSGRVTR